MRLAAAEERPIPLFARVVPPVVRGAFAVRGAARSGGTLSRAGARLVGGLAGLDPAGPMARADALRGLLAELCDAHRIERRVEGAFPAGPAVLVANHLGYLDPLVLGSLAPCAPIAKREVAAWPVVGAGARRLGVLFVDRGDPFSGAGALRQALRLLEAGVSVLCFPEGTTTRGEALLPFRRGLFGAARLAGVPIVPVALRYEDPSLCWVGDDDFLPHYLRTAARARTVAHVRIGRPIAACATRRAEELAAEARAAIAGLQRSLSP